MDDYETDANRRKITKVRDMKKSQLGYLGNHNLDYTDKLALSKGWITEVRNFSN